MLLVHHLLAYGLDFALGIWLSIALVTIIIKCLLYSLMYLGLVAILAVLSLVSLHILAHGALLNINRGVDKGADIVTEKRKCTASWSEPWLHSYTWQTSISSANRAMVNQAYYRRNTSCRICDSSSWQKAGI